MKTTRLIFPLLLLLAAAPGLLAQETYRARTSVHPGIGEDRAVRRGTLRTSNRPRVVTGGELRRSHLRRFSRHRRPVHRGLRIGTGLNLSFNSGDFGISLRTGGSRLLVSSSTHVFGTNLFRTSLCRHGRRRCPVCVTPIVITDEFLPYHIFYGIDLDYGDDELRADRDFDDILGSSQPVRHPQASNRPVVVKTEAQPLRGRDFPSNLSPLFGGPGRVGAWFATGERRYMAGQFEQAADAFSRAADGSPADPAPRMALAMSYAATGDYWAGGRMLRRAARLSGGWSKLRVDPEDGFGSVHTYVLVRRKAEVFTRRNPEDEDALFMLGFLYYMADKPNHAAIYLDRAARVEELGSMGDELRAEVKTMLSER